MAINHLVASWARCGLICRSWKSANCFRRNRADMNAQDRTLQDVTSRDPGTGPSFCGSQPGIWLVSFMSYDLGYIDLEEKTLQPLDNPFGPKV